MGLSARAVSSTHYVFEQSGVADPQRQFFTLNLPLKKIDSHLPHPLFPVYLSYLLYVRQRAETTRRKPRLKLQHTSERSNSTTGESSSYHIPVL